MTTMPTNISKSAYIPSNACSVPRNCTRDATVLHVETDYSLTWPVCLHDLIHDHFQQSRLHGHVDHFDNFCRSREIRDE